MEKSYVDLECFCGSFKGMLKNISPKKGFHVHCLCKDCQNFAKFLKNDDKILDEFGGTDLFQTRPANIEISQGEDKIACIKLKEKGIYRWYVTCCNAPFANTMIKPKMPFAGVSVKIMKFRSEEEKQQLIGPVVLKAFGSSAIKQMPEDAHETFPKSFMFNISLFLLTGFLRKEYKPSPFFKNGSPTIEPVLVGKR